MRSLLKNLKHITRKSFNSSFDVDKVRLVISNTLDFESNINLVYNFVNLYAEYGLVLLECDKYTHAQKQNTEEILENNQLNLQYLFGSTSHYDKADDRGVVHINSHSPNAVIDIPSVTFPFHTDGSYKPLPEKIQSLGCVIAANPSKGGKSIFVSGSYLMEYIYELCDYNDIYYEGFKILFENDCLITGRALINEEYRESTKAILKSDKFKTKNIIQIAFPPQGQIVKVHSNENFIKLWNKIQDFVADPINQLQYQLQPNEIIVSDNYCNIHSRTPFGETELRIMKRLNFENDENGILYQSLLNGMEVNDKYMPPNL